ncbi:MAG: dihydropteroate synthase [Candidatus Delongbacteria bacterium]
MARPLDALLRRLREPGRGPLLMGIVNLTPDSFSDGGRWQEPGRALDQVRALVAAGAEIVDLGGESTRPGAAPVDEAEELARVEPVLRALPADLPAWLSIDTQRRSVAAVAQAAGAVLVNDVSAGGRDPELLPWVVSQPLAYVLMHMRGRPAGMQEAPRYENVALEVAEFLRSRAADLSARGLPRERILLDPGIGFGKRLEDNRALLRTLAGLRELGHPLLLGASRKSFIGQLEETAGQPASPPDERLGGSLAAALWAAAQGVHVLRVHDVAQTRQALQVWRWLEDPAWK